MYTPHPSLVPIEMASAGMLTVTNTFENKSADALAEISANLMPVEPSIEGVTAGLLRAVAEVTDFDRRLRGSALNWSRSWEQSFDDQLISRLRAVLDRAPAAAP